MRKKLQKYAKKNRLFPFSATIKQINKNAILLIRIKDASGKHVAEHIWIPNSKKRKRFLKENDQIQFSAIVKPYQKINPYGEGWIKDYKFTHITKERIVRRSGLTYEENQLCFNKSAKK